MGRKKTKEIEQKPEQEQEEVSKKAYEFFSRKKDRGFTAMTKEASMIADENKKPPTLPKRTMNGIHKIRDDK